MAGYEVFVKVWKQWLITIKLRYNFTLGFVSCLVPNSKSCTINPNLIALFEMFARVSIKTEDVFSSFYEKKLALSLSTMGGPKRLGT